MRTPLLAAAPIAALPLGAQRPVVTPRGSPSAGTATSYTLSLTATTIPAAVFRSRYILDLPASLTPRIVERNLSTPRTMRMVHDRTIYTWTARNAPKITFEPFAADSNGVVMQIMIGTPTTWSGVAQW